MMSSTLLLIHSTRRTMADLSTFLGQDHKVPSPLVSDSSWFNGE
jgi:hypothetical protein